MTDRWTNLVVQRQTRRSLPARDRQSVLLVVSVRRTRMQALCGRCRRARRGALGVRVRGNTMDVWDVAAVGHTELYQSVRNLTRFEIGVSEGERHQGVYGTGSAGAS